MDRLVSPLAQLLESTLEVMDVTQVEATLIEGVLKPDQTLPLPDHARVHLIIEPIQEWSPERALAAWQAIQERLCLRPIHGGGLEMLTGR